MSSGKKHSLKAGDLVAMTEDRSQVALVEMDACALEKNWVVLVSRANVPTV